MSSPASTSLPAAATAVAPRAFEAVIFDMDGVVTRTAEVHATAWRRMFDAFLARREAGAGEALHAFAFPADYLAYIDGRPRYDGVAAFLASRGIALPWGTPEDPAGDATVCALGNRKNALFNEVVANEGVGVFASTLRFIAGLKADGIRVGLATSSRNSAFVLEAAGTAELFETVVDGLVSAELGLRGKPEPDIFLTACARLGVAPGNAVVVEDAATGVQAGHRGGFALTIGLAREDNTEVLCEHGADLVLGDLAGIKLPDLYALVLARRELQP